VLIEGETGTGKSFLAEHVIHPRSGAKGPLVVTDLSTVPSALLPAHLFGTRRGAYTGAVDDHTGVFEQAHGGTLFLDEIANLDLDLQRQLLLVLERGQVTRLGDNKPRPAAPKLVAATNQDLSTLVRQGRFRPDLFMRFNPATRLQVPPIRERQEDLPELVRFAFTEALRSDGLRSLVRQYLARFPTPDDFSEQRNNVMFGRPNARAARQDAFSVFISREALARLAAHPWPGNHRELRLFATNALVHALGLAMKAPEGQQARAPAILTVSDKSIDRLLASSPTALVSRIGRADSERGRSIEIRLPTAPSFSQVAAGVEKQYLRALFLANDGDLEKMAKELLGPKGDGRKVHLRLNRMGLRLRELKDDGT
jgi:DNA-binding NtrC family response regulator